MSKIFSITSSKGLCSSRLLCLDSRQFKKFAVQISSSQFSTSFKSFAEDEKEPSETDASEPAEKEDHPRSKKFQFFKENAKKYSVGEGASLQPAQYLGKNGTPFPMNPLFKHTVPLTNERKKQIFEAYLKDPEKNTLRSLAVSFKISIRRVEAILKLKHLELEMVKNGFVSLKKYQSGMEKILNAGNDNAIEELEPILPKLGKPLFRAVDEEVEFSPKDAAEEMKRPEFSELTKELLKDRVFEYHGLSGKEYNIDKETKPQPISVDSTYGTHKKFNYMFSDINPKLSFKERAVLVREKDGVLREASKLERMHYARRTNWPEQGTLFKRELTEATTPSKTPKLSL